MPVIFRAVLLVILLFGPEHYVWAQDSSAETPEEPPSTGRIVESRPPFYTLKRDLHPLTLLEFAAKPMFRAAESDRVKELLRKNPDTAKVSGVGFTIDGDGTGSGFGPIVTFFHKDLLGRGIDVQLPLLYTYKRYELYQFNAGVPVLREWFADTLRLQAGSLYRSHAEDDFFGVGNDTSRQNSTQFRLVERDAYAGLALSLNEKWTAGARVGYRNVGTSEPLGGGRSAQSVFSEASAPGLFTGAAFRYMAFSLIRDTIVRDRMRFTGGRDEFRISVNQAAGKGAFSYQGYSLSSEHFIPLTTDGRKVIALRGLIATTQPKSGNQVPFFDMPTLGSFSTVRGFENLRFRDQSAVAATLEYRYRIWPAMDFGLFVDTGQVAPHLSDMTTRFHSGYGARLFIWAKPNLPVVFDVAKSNETWRMYINLNTTF
jgi:outer membrane protein assembly factor BamA